MRCSSFVDKAERQMWPSWGADAVIQRGKLLSGHHRDAACAGDPRMPDAGAAGGVWPLMQTMRDAGPRFLCIRRSHSPRRPNGAPGQIACGIESTLGLLQAGCDCPASELVQNEIRDHQKDIAEFQQEAQSGTDPALKAFAQKTLPVLQKHLQMAQSLSGQC